MPTDKINIIANLLNIFAFETVTVSNTAVGLTSTSYINSSNEYAKKALITVETAQLRWRADGSDPTSTVGHILNPGDVLTLVGSVNIRSFRAIRTGSNNAKISASYSL